LFKKNEFDLDSLKKSSQMKLPTLKRTPLESAKYKHSGYLPPQRDVKELSPIRDVQFKERYYLIQKAANYLCQHPDATKFPSRISKSPDGEFFSEGFANSLLRLTKCLQQVGVGIRRNPESGAFRLLHSLDGAFDIYRL
jgi:hypothetical protein